MVSYCANTGVLSYMWYVRVFIPPWCSICDVRWFGVTLSFRGKTKAHGMPGLQWCWSLAWRQAFHQKNATGSRNIVSSTIKVILHLLLIGYSVTNKNDARAHVWPIATGYIYSIRMMQERMIGIKLPSQELQADQSHGGHQHNSAPAAPF